MADDEPDRAAAQTLSEAGWWAVSMSPVTAAGMAEKYATLSSVVRDQERARRDLALRRAAGRWPGSLRECQLVHPERYAERLCASRWGAGVPALPRSVWRARGHAAIPLWAELHDLLGDQLAWRAAFGRTRGTHGIDAGVAAFIAALVPQARVRWPDADVLVHLAGPRLRARHAHAWLAARAGLSLDELEALLLGRR